MPKNINIGSRKSLLLTSGLIVIGMVCASGYLLYSRSKALGARISGSVSYTSIMRETIHGRDGIARQGKELTHAVRSDGAIVRRVIHSNPINGVERVIQLPSGVEITVNEPVNIKSTIAKKLNPLYLQRDPASKCISSLAGRPLTTAPEVISGEEVIDGYRTVKITIDGERKIAFWFALDYGCAQVKDRIDFGGQEFSEHTLVTLMAGEPDSALFNVSDQLREAPTSERMLSVGDNRRRCEMDSNCTQLMSNLDRTYYKLRP